MSNNVSRLITLHVSSFLLAGSLSGCGAPPEPEPEAALGTGEQDITAEVLGKAVVVARKYADPEIARVAYASADIDGLQCSATMIGPNVLMTAAHCNDFDRVVTFRTYRDQSPWVSDTESYDCRAIVNTWPRSDLELYWCDSKNGLGPGDKFGYLDLDASVVSNQSFESVWWNPVDNLGFGDAHLYSAGAVGQTGVTLWADNFGVNGPANQPKAVQLTTWAAPGASGSSNVNSANHRILVGPTTIVNTGQPAGTAMRQALPMRVYLREATAETAANTPPFMKPGIKESTLAALGLTNTSQYFGLLDKDWDYLFDVPVALERARGENQRDLYWLGFESDRRNALWTKGAGVSLSAASGAALVNTSGPGQFLRHAGLNLQPNTNYRVVVRMFVHAAANASALSILLQKNGSLQDARFGTTTPGWQVVNVPLHTAGVAPDLVLNATAALNATIFSVVVVRESASYDFDTADKRSVWTDAAGNRPSILPDGLGAGPNWAGVVRRSPGGQTWPLQTRAPAMEGGTAYRICFDAKTHQTYASIMQNWATLQLVAGGTTTHLWHNFTPTTSWQTFCTTGFTPPTSDNLVAFGVNTEWVDGVQFAGFLVDNLRYEKVSCAGHCGGAAGGCYCDPVCIQYGDCCADKVQVCGP